MGNEIAIVERLDILVRQNERIIQLLDEEYEDLEGQEPTEDELLEGEDDEETPENIPDKKRTPKN